MAEGVGLEAKTLYFVYVRKYALLVRKYRQLCVFEVSAMGKTNSLRGGHCVGDSNHILLQQA